MWNARYKDLCTFHRTVWSNGAAIRLWLISALRLACVVAVLSFDGLAAARYTLPSTQLLPPKKPVATVVAPVGSTKNSSAKAPSNAPSIQQIGQSTRGYPIEVYRFGTGSKRIVLVGGIHGGFEWNSVQLAWNLIDHFTTYPAMIPLSLTVEIVPVANPDGLMIVAGSAGRVSRAQISRTVDRYAGRLNGNKVDLNRNWDCEWAAVANGPRGRVSGGDAPMSEVETKALATLLDDPAVLAAIFWHSAANGVFAGGCEGEFPAATTLAQRYAKASGYPFQSDFTGYAITGDASNWLTKQGIPAIVVELRTADQSEFQQNLAGVLAVLTQFP